MKERFNIEIAGIGFSIVSDDGKDFVRQTESALSASVEKLLKHNKSLSKLDAVAIVALDYCGELIKAESKIKNLEAQIEILEANMQRKREDAPVDNAPAIEDTSADVPAEPKSDEPVPADTADESADADAGDSDGSRDQKFRQLEALLGSQLKFDIDN